MLAHWIRQEEIKAARKQGWLEGYAEGYAEARAEAQAEARAKAQAEGRALERKVWQEWRRSIEAWAQRRTDAENAGQRFNEPRPKPPTDD